MGEIPEDIVAAADAVAKLDGGDPGCHLAYLVARAILAERNRCATIARKLRGDLGPYENLLHDQIVQHDMAERIEAAILA